MQLVMLARLLTVIVSATLAGQAHADTAFGIEQVADGVYVHRGQIALMSSANRGDIANIGFIVGQDAVAVIDTGGSVAVGRALLAAINDVTDRPVRYVINTHMHPDHIFGNAAFKSAEPEFAGHAKLPRALAVRAQHYLDANRELLGATLIDDVEIIQPGILVQGTLRLDLGGRMIELRAWPTAHTDNDLTVFDEKTATLFAGDLLFMGHVPVVDGSIRMWLNVMDDMAAIPAVRVVPGHGPATADWPQALDAQRAYLNRLAADVRELIKNGEPLQKAAQIAGRSERGHWELFDEFNARSATAAFSELEWE